MPKNSKRIRKFTTRIDQNEMMQPLQDSSINHNMEENHYMIRLQEMEELNAHLETIIGQQTKELIEIAESNLKFISIIAHDLRSPFTAIIGVLELLKTSLKDFSKNETEKFLNMASLSAENTLGLLDNLLVWTVAQNKARSFNPVKSNLQELVMEEIDIYYAAASQKQITIKHSIARELNIIADLQMIKTVFRNLIGNAVKYTNNGGIIDISAQKDNSHVEITIKDNGVGISLEAQKNLFRSYEMHSTEGTKNEKGSGLGLLLCKEFVEMHHGSIHTKSESGRGCQFTVSLPLTDHARLQ